jgi:hypothetical protein
MTGDSFDRPNHGCVLAISQWKQEMPIILHNVHTATTKKYHLAQNVHNPEVENPALKVN